MALWVFDYKCKYSDRVVFWIDDQMYTRVIPQSLSSNVVSKKPLLFRELWRQADFPLVVSNEIPGDALPRTEILFEKGRGSQQQPRTNERRRRLACSGKKEEGRFGFWMSKMITKVRNCASGASSWSREFSRLRSC